MGIMTERLRERADPVYREFMAGILPTVDKSTILGVRAPAMRGLVKEVRGTADAEAFLTELPHAYYDENALHACLLREEKDYATCLERVRAFLPFIDNWGVCDALVPRVFAKHTGELKPLVREWALDRRPYVCRFGLSMMMWFYLDVAFDPALMDLAASVRSDEYYVNMMIAWYFATALAKQEQAALAVIESRRLAVWTHNKAIQKAVESRRIAPELKAYLKTLRSRGGQRAAVP